MHERRVNFVTISPRNERHSYNVDEDEQTLDHVGDDTKDWVKDTATHFHPRPSLLDSHEGAEEAFAESHSSFFLQGLPDKRDV